MSRMERRRQAELEKENSKKKKSVLNIILTILLVLVILAAAVMAVAYWYVNSKLNQLTEVPVNADVENFGDYELSCVDMDGYINVLILGIDARDMNDPDEDWRSDAIMVASIKESTGDVYLTSIYRDTLFYMPDQGFYDKITHAFTYGGVKESMKAINQAMDLNIKNYVVFNFKAAADVIDAMGGLELDIEEYEIEQLNKYNKETWRVSGREGKATQITQAGTQHVDGCMAVTYGRIRKGVGDDYKRTERMRIVVGKMLERAKQLSFKEIDNCLDVGLPQIKTNLSNSDIMGLGFKMLNFKMSGTTSFPYSITDGYMGAVSYVFPADLYGDVIRLHEEFFGQKDYKPSETVLTISSVIYQYAVGSGDAPVGEISGGDGSDIGGSSLWTDIPEPEPWTEPYYDYEPIYNEDTYTPPTYDPPTEEPIIDDTIVPPVEEPEIDIPDEPISDEPDPVSPDPPVEVDPEPILEPEPTTEPTPDPPAEVGGGTEETSDTEG